MAIRTNWRELTSRIRLLIGPRKAETPRRSAVVRRWSGEEFRLDLYQGGSVLMGRFWIGDRFMLVTHRQGDEDTFPLPLKERKEILRRTIQERIKKEARRFGSLAQA